MVMMISELMIVTDYGDDADYCDNDVDVDDGIIMMIMILMMMI